MIHPTIHKVSHTDKEDIACTSVDTHSVRDNLEKENASSISGHVKAILRDPCQAGGTFFFFLLKLQFVRFCLVGVVNDIINYGLFLLLLNEAALDYRLAGICGYFAGAISGFALNRLWTFKSDVAIKSGTIKYLLIQTFCLGVHSMTQIFATSLLEIPEAFSQLAGIIVTTFLNYALTKRFVF